MNYINSNILKYLLLISAIGNLVFSQEDSISDHKAHEIVYVEVATILLVGSGSINYEYLLKNGFSLRAGLGLGYMFNVTHGTTKNAYGPLTMLYYSFPETRSKMEVGLGGSLMNLTDRMSSEVKFLDGEGWRLTPSLSIGYRYQPNAENLFFRIGFTYVYLFGGPIQISFGKTF